MAREPGSGLTFCRWLPKKENGRLLYCRCLPIGFWLVVSLYWDDDPQIGLFGKGKNFPTSLHWGQGRLRVHRGLPGCWMSCSCCCGGRWWCISWFSKCFWLNLYVFPCFSMFSHVFLQIANWWMFLIFAWQLHPAVRACINMFALWSYPPFPSCETSRNDDEIMSKSEIPWLSAWAQPRNFFRGY